MTTPDDFEALYEFPWLMGFERTGDPRRPLTVTDFSESPEEDR